MAKLTTAGIRSALKIGRPELLGDGQGLYLRQRPSGSYWFLRCKHKGRSHELALGKWPEVGLAEARENAAPMRRRIKSGLPAREEEKSLCPTYEALAHETWEAKKPSWENGKHVQQWISTQATYAFPKIGKMAVDQITATDVLAVLQPLWHNKQETAKRLKQRLNDVFERALAKGFIEINPVTKAKAALGKQRIVRKHFESIHYSELADALATLDNSGASFGLKCLARFSALTAVRPGEARGARWSEMDLESKVWHIPAQRKKERRDFDVPLSSQAIDILEAMQPFQRGPDGLIFPGQRSTRPYSENSVRVAFKRCGIPSTAHGLRSTIRVWMQESGIDWDLGETILAHAVGNDVAQAYARSDQLKRRREVLDRWANYIDQQSAKVVQLYG